MARLGVLRFALMGLWILHVQADFNDDLATKINGVHGPGNFFEQCYERCYQVIDGTEYERYRPAFKEFYEMGEEARRLKNMRSANGTVFLLDSTLSDHNDPAENPDLNPEELGANIWQFQRDLASIVAYHLDSYRDMAGGMSENPIAITQFNQDAAWDCNTHTCLDCCQAVEIMQTENRLTALEMDNASDRRGNIEPACRMAYINMREPDASLSCETSYYCNEMAVAFFNSDFYSNVHASNEWDDYSPCDEHFDTRLAIGTNDAHYHKLKEWSSLDAHSQYIKDNMYTFEAARDLVQCMTTRCCGPAPAPQPQSTQCARSTDHFGEETATMADHSELTPPGI